MKVFKALVIACCCIAATAFSQTYTGTVIPGLSPTTGTYPNAINDSRVVVGHSFNSSNIQKPFFWVNGVTTQIPELMGVSTSEQGACHDINNSGWAIGLWSGGKAFYYNVNTGVNVHLTVPGYTTVNPIKLNNNNVVLCSVRNSPYGDSYLVTYNITTGQYGYYGQYYRLGRFINNATQTIGGADMNNIINLVAGTSFAIPTPSGYYSPEYVASNSFGAIAGSLRNTDNGDNRACIYRPFTLNGAVGRVEFIPGLDNSAHSYIKGMNEWGWVVGYAYRTPMYTGAFLWKGGTGNAVNLTSVKPSNIPGNLTIAMGINTGGDIIGHTNQSGPNSGYILFGN